MSIRNKLAALLALCLLAGAAHADGINNLPPSGYVHATITAGGQTGTASTAAFVMNGFQSGVSTFTPAVSGKVRVSINSYASNSLQGDGCLLKIAYGTGTGPANGAAATGTVLIIAQQIISGLNSATVAYSPSATITGLTISQAYWVDAQFEAVTGGTCTLGGATISYDEMP
jgi:hypothetical protein